MQLRFRGIPINILMPENGQYFANAITNNISVYGKYYILIQIPPALFPRVQLAVSQHGSHMVSDAE